MNRLTLSGALVLAMVVAGCSASAPMTDTDGPVAPPPPMGDMEVTAECTDGTADLPDGAMPTDDGITAFDCNNVDLVAYIPLSVFDADQLNDIWGWTDPETNREYALVGLANGTEFIDITNPTEPVVLGKLPTHTVSTVWRDIKVYKDHAFIVSEARDHGMQVFDLTRLRGLASDQGEFTADAHYDQVTNVHNIVINEDTGFAYAVGSGSRGDDLPAECGAPGFHVINIEEPLNPTFVNCFSDASKDLSPVAAPGYTHDAQCILYDEGPDQDYIGREICAASNEDVVTFFDVTDKMDVRVISMAEYPQDAYTHQGWFTEDRRAFLANDELDETNGYVSTQRTLLFNVEDLDAPEFIGVYDSGMTTIDHNLYVLGNYTFMSNYQSGLRIVDHSRILDGEITEVASFDTYPQGTDIGFGGQWSNYPYFPSGLVVASDSNNGFFILRPRLDRVSM
ncbi:MAG: choice-of-anchor B family protein [Bacteroidota bacterium]